MNLLYELPATARHLIHARHRRISGIAHRLLVTPKPILAAVVTLRGELMVERVIKVRDAFVAMTDQPLR